MQTCLFLHNRGIDDWTFELDMDMKDPIRIGQKDRSLKIKFRLFLILSTKPLENKATYDNKQVQSQSCTVLCQYLYLQLYCFFQQEKTHLQI